jgi:hypothetical protein
MAAETHIPEVITFRPNDEDRKIIKALKRKLGANVAGIIRQALRTLRDKENAA